MHRATIMYSVPDDPEEFLRRYRDEHLPLVDPVPGLRRFSWSTPRCLGGTDAPVFLVAELDFDDKEQMKAALGSPEMAAAGAHADELGVARVMYLGEVETPVDA